MGPLTAFQVLCGAVSATALVEAVKKKSWVGGAIGLALAILAVTTKPLSDAVPTVGAFLAAIGGNPLSWWIAVIAALAVWMARRSAAAAPTRPEAPVLPYDDSKLRADFQEVRSKYQAVVEDYQRMNGLEARLSGVLYSLQDTIAAQTKVFEDRHLIDERNLLEFREEVLKSNGQLFLALQAIRAREQERFYAQIIEEKGKRLQDKVERNEPFQGQDWAEWEVCQNQLNSAMYKWLEIADGWHPQIRGWINDVHPDSLTVPEWGDIDPLFQRSGQVIAYKTQIAKFNNWLRLRTHVTSAIHLAAFGGPHAGEILEHIPGGAPTVDRVKERKSED